MLIVNKDALGNKIVVETNGIYLKLAGKKRHRKIAVIDKDAKALWMERKPAQHKLVKANAYGFNYEVLRFAKTATRIFLAIGERKYIVPIQFILRYGDFLHFKTQGFERQIFLTENALEQFEVETFE